MSRADEALSGLRPLRPGQTVLIQGSGGVSVFAVQLARLIGARAIATTSSPGKAARLKAFGADEVINYVETPAWGDRVRELPKGAASVGSRQAMCDPSNVLIRVDSRRSAKMFKLTRGSLAAGCRRARFRLRLLIA